MPVFQRIDRGPELGTGGLAGLFKLPCLSLVTPIFRAELLGLGELRLSFPGPSEPAKLQPKSKAGRRELALGIRTRKSQTQLLIRDNVLAARAIFNPVTQRRNIPSSFVSGLGCGLFWHLERSAVHCPKCIASSGVIGWSHYPALFIDPHTSRHIDDAVQVGDLVILVNQARISRRGYTGCIRVPPHQLEYEPGISCWVRLDERASSFGSLASQRYGNNGKLAVLYSS